MCPGLQHVSGGEGPCVDQPFEPLPGVALLQEGRQHHLQEEELQGQLADRGVAKETGGGANTPSGGVASVWGNRKEDSSLSH